MIEHAKDWYLLDLEKSNLLMNRGRLCR